MNKSFYMVMAALVTMLWNWSPVSAAIGSCSQGTRVIAGSQAPRSLLVLNDSPLILARGGDGGGGGHDGGSGGHDGGGMGGGSGGGMGGDHGSSGMGTDQGRSGMDGSTGHGLKGEDQEHGTHDRGTHDQGTPAQGSPQNRQYP